MPSRPDWLKPLEHTADIGMEVFADSPEVLFCRCAWGMFFELVDLDSVRPLEVRRIEVEAPERETLLLRWLSELNYIHSVEHLLFSRFEVTALTETHLTATVFGEPISPIRHTVLNEIKAVTYYLLKVEQRPQGWYARILFDI